MPVYNGECFLEDTLDSLVDQTFQDWELIISDNASTDGTEEICRSYVAGDPRIRYVRNGRNLGIASNFNRVFGLARGEYFKLATADDLCDRTLVTKCVAILDERPEVVLCYGKTMLIDAVGAILGPYEDNLSLLTDHCVERFRLVMERIRRVHVLQGVMRAAALRRTGLLGGYLGSDVVLVAELALQGQFYELPQRLFYRRIHPRAFNSLTPRERAQENLDPESQGGEVFYSWRQHIEYLRAIRRAPVPVREKLQLISAVARQVVESRGTLVSEVVEGVKAHLRR
jgi:glycosyltransferase involved in cell wall biosynthesis